MHALSAGLKAYTTATTQTGLSTCREACGGHGYAAVNRLGALRSDHDIFQTFEGDNTVLLQQVGRALHSTRTAATRLQLLHHPVPYSHVTAESAVAIAC